MNFKEVRKVLEYAGFYEDRSPSGSHVIFKNEDGVSVSVPDHGSKDISMYTLFDVWKDAGYAELASSDMQSPREAFRRIDAAREQQAEEARAAASIVTEEQRLTNMGLTPEQIALFDELPETMEGLTIENEDVSEAMETLILTKGFYAGAETEPEQESAVQMFMQEYWSLPDAVRTSTTLAARNIDQFRMSDVDPGSLSGAQNRAAQGAEGRFITIPKSEAEPPPPELEQAAGAQARTNIQAKM